MGIDPQADFIGRDAHFVSGDPLTSGSVNAHSAP